MASLTEKIQEACEAAKRDGRELIVCILDDRTQGLRVISSLDKLSHTDIMRSLNIITETYLEENHGETSTVVN